MLEIDRELLYTQSEASLLMSELNFHTPSKSQDPPQVEYLRGIIQLFETKKKYSGVLLLIDCLIQLQFDRITISEIQVSASKLIKSLQQLARFDTQKLKATVLENIEVLSHTCSKNKFTNRQPVQLDLDRFMDGEHFPAFDDSLKSINLENQPKSIQIAICLNNIARLAICLDNSEHQIAGRIRAITYNLASIDISQAALHSMAISIIAD